MAVALAVFGFVAVDNDAAGEVPYGSDSVGADKITFNANGGSGGFAQYVMNGNTITFPSEYEADDPYNQYTKISKSGYVLKGWSESRTATTPTYYPGQSYPVYSDKIFYAIWESTGYNNGVVSDVAVQKVIAKGSTPSITMDSDLEKMFKEFSTNRTSIRYTLTVTHDGSEQYSQAFKRSTTVSADWLTCTIASDGGLSFSGKPQNVGVYTIVLKLETKGFSGDYGDLDSIMCKWYVSVADPSMDPSVMYHVTFDGEDIVNGYGPYMTAVKLPDAQKGHPQKGWNITVNQSPAIFPVGGSYSVVQKDTMLTISEYTFEEVMASGVVGVIAYNANGGYYEGQFAELVPTNGYAGLKSGSIVTKEGYTFIGWNESGSASDPIYPESYLYDIKSTYVELKAVWVSGTVSKFPVYLSNPSDGSMDTSFEAASGYSYYLPVHGFDMSRYKFLGWSSTSYPAGEGEVTEGQTIRPTSSCTYYAVYESMIYEFVIKYRSGPGDGLMKDQAEESENVPYDMMLAHSTFTPPEGYEFVGWSESKYATAPSYLAGDYYTFYESGELMLFAVFTKIIVPEEEDPENPDDPQNPDDPRNPEDPEKPVVNPERHLFKLMFVGNGATGNVPQSIYRILADVDECALYVPDTVPVRTGYKFLGWGEAASGSVVYVPNDRVSMKLADGETEKTVVLYAIWEATGSQQGGATKITITFVSDGSTLYQTSIASGQTVPYRTPVSKECYAFIGWYHNSTAWNFDTVATESMTLTAIYQKVFHTVVKDDTVQIVMDVDASPIAVSFSSDGFQHSYDTSSIPAHKVGYSVTGSVSVDAKVNGATLKATATYKTGNGGVDPENPDVPQNPDDPQKEDNTTILIASGVAAGLLAVGCALYWRYKI